MVRSLLTTRSGLASAAPERTGVVRHFYDDGGLTATGRRKDGSLMRTGSFDRGRQVGAWTTYGRDSTPLRVTDVGR